MRTNPFGDLDELLERMGTELPVGLGGPRIDLIDEGESFVLLVDIPGYDRDDLDITLRDRQLTVSATRSADEVDIDDDEERYVRRERDRHGASRTVRLPEAVDADGVTASYDRGVLEITLPKREPEEGHTIDVE